MTPRLGTATIALATAVVLVSLAARARVQEPLSAVEWGHVRAAQERAALAATRPPSAGAGLLALSPAERRDAVDAYWGAGLPTATKLAIFEKFWNYVDAKYAAFQGIDVDWSALRTRYLPEIAAGVSGGRFAAIMNHLSLALLDSHSQVVDWTVNIETIPERGVPLLAVGAWTFDTSGACVTALDDGSALVYSAMRGHPLGLQRGDRILGYDGIPNRQLDQQLCRRASCPARCGTAIVRSS